MNLVGLGYKDHSLPENKLDASDQDAGLSSWHLCLWVSTRETLHVRIQRGGGTGGPDPLKNHKNLGFLSNSGPGPLKNYEATEPAFNVGPSSARQRNTI